MSYCTSLENIDALARPYNSGEDMKRLDYIVRKARSLAGQNWHNEEREIIRLE